VARLVFAGTGTHSQTHISVSIVAMVGMSHMEPHQLHQSCPKHGVPAVHAWGCRGMKRQCCHCGQHSPAHKETKRALTLLVRQRNPGARKHWEEGGRGE